MKQQRELQDLPAEKLRRLLDEHDDKNGTGFAGGLVLGALAGVAGMFLFGTKRGKKLVSQAETYWYQKEPILMEKAKKFKIEDLGKQIQNLVKYLEKKKEK